MAKAKASRKGKKEWRRNISTKEYDAVVEKEGHEERTGGSLEGVPDAAIFVVDTVKGPNKHSMPPHHVPDTKILRKVDRHRNRTLHVDSALKRSSLVPPVSWSLRKKELPGGEVALPPAVKNTKLVSKSMARVAGVKPVETGKKRDRNLDPWNAEELESEVLDGEVGSGIGETQRQKKKSKAPVMIARITERVHSRVAAVQVDQPGCSYNPSFQDHQDALGEAVAFELQKEYAKELQPQAPKLTVPAPLYHMEEEDRYFLEAGGGEEGEEELEGAEVGEEEARFVPKPVQVNRKTQADLNRKVRRRAAEEAAKKSAGRKEEAKQLGRLQEMEQQLEEEVAEVERRRVRKAVSREERRAGAPPRLGPHKFVPEAVQVLLTEEVTGSLRQLKGCFTLARDRFKSLQRRGLVEPRMPAKKRQAKNRRVVEQGTQGKKEREGHAEILAMRAARKEAAALLVHD